MDDSQEYSSNLQEMLREKNDEVYLALRLAPPDLQPQLFAMFVIFHEAYEACTMASEPIVGKIKIAWWRERLEEIAQGTKPRPHPALLALNCNHQHFPKILKILDEFENMLDGWKPKNFTEIATFISKTFGELFSICGEICATQNAEKLGFAYGNLYLLRKFKHNKNMFQGSAEIAETAEKNFLENMERLPEETKKAAFAVIIAHNKKQEKPKRWKLILKLLFQAKTAL